MNTNLKYYHVASKKVKRPARHISRREMDGNQQSTHSGINSTSRRQLPICVVLLRRPAVALRCENKVYHGDMRARSTRLAAQRYRSVSVAFETTDNSDVRRHVEPQRRCGRMDGRTRGAAVGPRAFGDCDRAGSRSRLSPRYEGTHPGDVHFDRFGEQINSSRKRIYQIAALHFYNTLTPFSMFHSSPRAA